MSSSTGRPLRVSVPWNLWLRRRLDTVTRGYYPQSLARRLGVGQGPMEFLNRLMAKAGANVRFVPSLRNSDVGLFVGAIPETAIDYARRHGIRLVLRLDGIGLDSSHLQSDAPARRAMSSKIEMSIRHADGLIFQSCFAQAMFRTVFGEWQCRSTVIPNGFVFNKGNRPAMESRTLIVAGRDSPRKRIRETIECFKSSPYAESYKLEVIGDIPAHGDAHRAVHYLGRLNPKALCDRLCRARALLHLDWYDWCPNLVGEAIAAGIPVLCGRVGGTLELVGRSGLAHDLQDPTPDFIANNLKTPPLEQWSFDAALHALLTSPKTAFEVERPDLAISNVSQRYELFLERVVADI